jgi:two-component system, NtrC family, response regulator AlgB
MTPPPETRFAPFSVLVVDDEANIRKTLSYCLGAEGHRVFGVGNPEDALAEARRRHVDLAFLDLRLGDRDGMDIIPALISDSPWLKIVVVTAYASIESAVEAMRRGAADYIPKPFSPDQVRLVVRRIGRIVELEREVAALKARVRDAEPEDWPRTRNPAMRRIVETAKKAAPSEAILLLQGESGTGKTAFARAIHRWSARASRPLGVVSCPTIPPDLLESELFGHARGAFTGAARDFPGRIAACEGGTLFLDEIAEMTVPVQAKLLRFIQDKEYERLGDIAPRKADVRIVAATNADLERRVAEGRFREDLFHRLNVIRLTLPPLRVRTEDILPMAKDFLAFFDSDNPERLLGFTEEAEEALESYPWPGNIRELRNAVERAAILGAGERIGIGDLPENIRPVRGAPAVGDRVALSVIEELHIRRVLAATESLQEAANVLEIDPATLWRKRKSYGI